MGYGDPSLQDLMRELEAIHRDITSLKEEMRPKLLTIEHFAEAVGWSSLKNDLSEIKASLGRLASAARPPSWP